MRLSLKKIIVLITLCLAVDFSEALAPDENTHVLQVKEQAGKQSGYWNRVRELLNCSQKNFSSETSEDGVSSSLHNPRNGDNSPEGLCLDPAGLVPAKGDPGLKPSALGVYPASDRASRYPLLIWTKVEGAVYYEIEFLQDPPENPNGTELSNHSLWSSREVYKNGYIADLSWFAGESLYWRVRALDYYGKPLGVFSDVQLIQVDTSVVPPLKPFLTADMNSNGQPTPLYPVYAWIPVPGATVYEVELCSQLPENPNGTTPSRYRIWGKKGPGYDLYDDIARIEPGAYYWRVRGFDEADRPIGVYSDAGKFEVDLSRGNYAACFGDSITHGGGALSYSPSDPEYSFETYLNFPVVNLGRSGDTTATMNERFIDDVLPFQPRYLIILGGTNSIRGGVTGEQVVRELTQLRDSCIKHNIRPIFLTLPPVNPEAILRVFGEETAPYWQREMAVVNQFIRQQRYYIDIEPFLTDQYGLLPECFAVDGLHPDVEAKEIIGRIINENWARVTR